MLQIEYELGKMCREHRAGGRTTQADRLALAATVGRDLDACGYHRFSRQKHCSRKLKDKHVRGLVAHWTGKGLRPGTINNRLAFLRHVCDWTGRGGVMSKRNADYHDGRRVREATVSKAAYVGAEVLARVRNRYAQASLRLQVAFGLRRKEALMIQPVWADRGNRLVLHDTWTKGGRRREIPLTTAAQRQTLDHAKGVAGQGSPAPHNDLLPTIGFMWSYTYRLLRKGVAIYGQIEEGDVRVAAGVAQGPGAGSRGKRHQRAGGRIADSAGSPGAARQRLGAETQGEGRVGRQGGIRSRCG